MAFSNNKNDGSMSEINITPMVDVMLVLLIIFMVAAPMMQAGIQMDIPKSKARSMIKDDDIIMLELDKKGQLFFRKEERKTSDIDKLLNLELKLKKDTQVFIRADEKLEYGRVVEIMGEVQNAGFSKIGLVTEVLN